MLNTTWSENQTLYQKQLKTNKLRKKRKQKEKVMTAKPRYTSYLISLLQQAPGVCIITFAS